MGRILAIGLSLVLAACNSGETPKKSAAETAIVRTSTSNSADSRVAKDVFGHIPAGSQQPSQAIGFFSRGCQSGSRQLPETGPTWQAMRLSRNRNWAQPQTVSFVQDLSVYAAQLPGWNGLYVGDMSQPRGGPMLSGHASHQSGLDADIWLRPANRLNLSRQEREDISSISMRKSSGAFTNDKWTSQHEALLKRAASDPRVARIFIFPGAKVAMCKNATGDRSWLSKIRPWWGHHYHFHVRLKCPAGAQYCEDQAPPPPGDGCAEAQGWVDRILNPPPPDPNAPAPKRRGPLRMSQLPAECAAVATSQ